MTPDSVATFLQEHPEFFEQYADTLAEIYIPHPHGGRAIPISERQILTLRERSRQLETKLREVIRFGEENDAIGEKVHRLTLALIGARDLEHAVAAVHYHLREDFAIPHVAMRVWDADGAAVHPQLGPVTDGTRAFASGLNAPNCGARSGDAIAADLFGETAAQLKSFSFVPLGGGETSGVLALASEDAERFYPEMGTVYLKRIGDIVGAALMRNLTG
jgi:uncharacterized protein YigA (DUF484 family)